MDKATLKQGYARLFDKAGLRTTEVATIIGVHRVTASRWKHGDIHCDDTTLIKLKNLILYALKAYTAGELPLDKFGIAGKNARLAVLKQILLRHAKKER